MFHDVPCDQLLALFRLVTVGEEYVQRMGSVPVSWRREALDGAVPMMDCSAMVDMMQNN